METLIALAILSLTSLVLFQSTSTMLSVSDKAATASERVVEDTITRETYKNIVRGLTPGWPEQESSVFRGRPEGFSGLSVDFPSLANDQLVEVSVVLRPVSQGGYDLIIQSAGSSEFALENFEAGYAEFRYMGQDQVFYPVWPPEKLQFTGFAVDESLATPPPLPEAIRLELKSSTRDSDTVGVWLAAVKGQTILPYKDKTATKINDF